MESPAITADMAEQEGKPKTIKSVQNVVDILELIRHEDVTASEVADRTGYAKSTIHYYLKTLEAAGYVISESGSLRLGLRLLDLSDGALAGSELFHAGREETVRLANETDAVTRLVAEEHGRGIVVCQSGGEGIDLVGPDRIQPLHTTAYGKAILAHLSMEYQNELIESNELVANTPQTITDPESLRDELDHIREEGIAVSDEEHSTGVRSIAAPILDLHSEDAIGAVGLEGSPENIPIPNGRQKAKRFVQNRPNLVRRTAKLIQNKVNETEPNGSNET